VLKPPWDKAPGIRTNIFFSFNWDIVIYYSILPVFFFAKVISGNSIIVIIRKTKKKMGIKE
jgi:hypothetical protein